MTKWLFGFLLLFFPLGFFAQASAQGTTWYVRADGGTRYSTNNTAGTCDGKGDAAPVGTKANQHCAFNDFRMIWTDPNGYNDQTWAIAGGDTVIIRGQAPFQAAGSAGSASQGSVGWGDGIGHSMSSVPSGTSARHTRILGENYGSCQVASTYPSGYVYNKADPAKTAKLWGGGQAPHLFDLSRSHFVDLECVDITDHSSCGSSATAGCSGTDSTQYGIWTGQTFPADNGDNTVQDVTVHGMSSRGMLGTTSGNWTFTRVDLERNPGAGWDMDPGNSANSTGNIIATDLHINWSGCSEEYPVSHAIPVLGSSCTDQSHGGYGDGFGSPPMLGLNFTCNRCSAEYNTQDGFDLGHMGGGTVVFENSFFQGNMGGNIKLGPSSVQNVHGNLILANCARMHDPISGTDPTYNKNLGDFCRANDGNGANVLGNSQYEGSVNSSGTALVNTNSSVQWTSSMSVGDYIVPADPNINTSTATWKRRVTAISDDTHLTIASPFPSAISNAQIVKLAATPGSTSVTSWTNNTFAGYVGTFIDGQCMAETGGGTTAALQLQVSDDQCIGYSWTFKDNVSIAFYDAANYHTDHNPVMWGFLTPTVQDYNLYYNFYGNNSFAVGSHDLTLNPLLTSQPALPIASESQLDNLHFDLTASSPAKYAGTTVPGVTSDAVGNAWHSPQSMGALEYGTAAAPAAATPTGIVFSSPNPLALTAGATAAPTCTVTLSDSSTETCLAGGAVFSSSAPTVATVSSSGVVSALIPGTGNITAAIGSIVGMDAVTISPARPTLNSLAFAAPVSLVVGATATPACTAVYSDSSTTSCAAAGASFVSDLPASASANSAGMLTALAAGSGHLVASVGSVIGADAFSVTAPPPAKVTAITVAQPQFGFNVIPGSTRRLFATVTNGSTNQVTWTVKSGSAQISSTSGSWVDVTAGNAGGSCQISASGKAISSPAQLVIEAISVDDTSKKADVVFNICNPTLQISTIPAYRTLYSKQTADIQSLVVGSVNDAVQWAITSQPTGGDGKLADSTSRDTVFSATVAGRYTLTATSVANQAQTAKSILYVTGHNMPYRVTQSMTEPVDCSVDPALTGTTFEVGPSQTYHRLQDIPLKKIIAGSTIRLHNEDTTGLTPTTFHEYVQLPQQAPAGQPVRICGMPDTAGNLPILDAANATGRSDTTASAAGAGLITVGGSTSGAAWPAFKGASNILVEGLHLRNARPGVAYTSPAGAANAWQTSAACILIAEGHNINLIGNELEACGNGALSQWNGATWGGSSLNHLWEGNYVHGNGTAGSSDNHQMYLQSWGQVVQLNRVDQITPGTTGANLKSRGIQDVIRYNYFGDGSARDMDLVDVQGPAQFMSFADFFQKNSAPTASTYSMDQLAAWQEAWNSHFAYGNIYLNSTSMAPIHFAYDGSAAEGARKGSLYWYNNNFYQATCASCSGQLWTMFDTSAGDGSYLPQTEFQTVQTFNNLVWMDSPSKPFFQWNNSDAFIGLGGSNLMPIGWGFNTLQGGAGDGWNASGNAAAYQNADNLSLHITGFNNNNIETLSTIPFDRLSWILNNPASGNASVPSAVCDMPTRFTYVPTLGYAVARSASPNIGATDTVPQTAGVLNLVGGGAHTLPHSSTCQ